MLWGRQNPLLLENKVPLQLLTSGVWGCFTSCLQVWGMMFIEIVATNQKSVLVLELLLGFFLLFLGQGVIRGANMMMRYVSSVILAAGILQSSWPLVKPRGEKGYLLLLKPDHLSLDTHRGSTPYKPCTETFRRDRAGL